MFVRRKAGSKRPKNPGASRSRAPVSGDPGGTERPGTQLKLYSAWYTHPSGLILPPSFRTRDHSAEFEDVPKEFLQPLLPIIVAKPPLPADARLKAYIDEPKLGLATSSLRDLKDMAARLPFERSMLVLSRLAARVFDAAADNDKQLALASEIFADTNVLEPIRRAVAQNEHLIVFSEQLVHLLMRVMIEVAPSSPIEREATLEESHLFLRALLATTGVTGSQSERHFDETNPESWIGLLVQHGEYSATSDFMLERNRELMMLDAASQMAEEDSRNYVDLERLHLEATGLTVKEQTRLGLNLAAKTHAFDEGPTAGENYYVTADEVEQVLAMAGLAEKRASAINAISAERDGFMSHFASLEGETSEMDSLLWETRPWKSKPFFRFESGDMLLLSPRFLRSWLSEGFYFRPLTAAAKHGRKLSGKITRLYGELYEQHCVARAEEAFSQIQGARVHGDVEYSRGKSGRTPDIMIEIGSDLILIEVTRSSISANTLVTGDLESTVGELKSKLVEKIDELAKNMKRVLKGDASRPTDPESFRRIWPIVVSGALPFQTPNLMMFVEGEIGDLTDDDRIQHLTLLDPTDFETLMGLVEGGHPIVGILEKKSAEPFRGSDFQWWGANDVRAPSLRARPASMEARIDADWIELLEIARPYLDDARDIPAEELLRAAKESHG